jgi:hypothetical protein
MSSAESDLADRRVKERQLDANLAQAREGHDRLRRLADREVETALVADTPNRGGRDD